MQTAPPWCIIARMAKSTIEVNGMGERGGARAAAAFRLLAEQFTGWRAGEVAWLAFCVASVAALSLCMGDTAAGVVAAVTGVLYTVFAGKGKILCFAFGLVNAPLYAWLSFAQGYYGDCALNFYYFAMMFPGAVAWARNRAEAAEVGVARTRLSPRGRVRLLVVCLLATAALWWILRLCGGSRPLCDAFTNVLSVAAMALTVRRAIEQWAAWIAVDAVEVFMWADVWLSGGGGASILAMWLLFLANGVYMLALWLRVANGRRTRD